MNIEEPDRIPGTRGTKRALGVDEQNDYLGYLVVLVVFLFGLIVGFSVGTVIDVLL